MIGDTKLRLQEWIEFHLLVGFDHIYVYDNSAAFSNETNLAPVTDKFPSDRVSRIDWPSQVRIHNFNCMYHVHEQKTHVIVPLCFLSQVCNNNIPSHDNTGERSSQYAAENSCRSRFGPYTEWIASFDADEYLVPMGDHTSLRSVVEGAKDTNILSFRSSRGKLRHSHSETIVKGRAKLDNVTFLEAMNCDSAPTPKPDWADRARKQLYRSDYVLNHFVHYSVVTKKLVTTYDDARASKAPWHRYFQESSPSERVTNEIQEATMIHTKSLDFGQTLNWKNRCRFNFKKKFLGCFIGFPWPFNKQNEEKGHDPLTGLEYNCFVNEKVDRFWIPKLREALARPRKADTNASG